MGEPTDASAMAKLLRKVVPYTGVREAFALVAIRQMIAEAKTAEARAALQQQLDDKAADQMEAELYRLEPLQVFEIEAWLVQAGKKIKDVDTDVRQHQLRVLQARLYAGAALRKAGTDGKVLLYEGDSAWDMDPQTAEDVFAAYQAAFVLTEAERPKAEAPRSTGA